MQLTTSFEFLDTLICGLTVGQGIRNEGEAHGVSYGTETNSNR